MTLVLSTRLESDLGKLVFAGQVTKFECGVLQGCSQRLLKVKDELELEQVIGVIRAHVDDAVPLSDTTVRHRHAERCVDVILKFVFVP